MATYQILIVEDDPDESDRLRSYLERYAAEHGKDLHVTTYDNAVPLIESRREFDLIFLDINLPGISGMEAAQLLRAYDETTLIVFVTDLAQYAVKGYEVNALDFVVKPANYYGISMRMDKAIRVLRRRSGRSVTLSAHGGLHVVPLAEIVYVEVANHDLAYHLASGDVVRVRGTMAAAAGELADGPFVRVSNSHLVNMDHIASVRDGAVVTSDGGNVFFSRARKRDALATIASYLGGSI